MFNLTSRHWLNLVPVLIILTILSISIILSINLQIRDWYQTFANLSSKLPPFYAKGHGYFYLRLKQYGRPINSHHQRHHLSPEIYSLVWWHSSPRHYNTTLWKYLYTDRLQRSIDPYPSPSNDDLIQRRRSVLANTKPTINLQLS